MRAVVVHDPSPAAIGQMKRVLVPGGRLLLLDHIAVKIASLATSLNAESAG